MLLAICVTGCASTMQPLSLIPQASVNAYQSPDPAEPHAIVVVYRDSSFTGAANYRWVGLDGSVIAGLLTAQRTQFAVSPGHHTVTVKSYCWWQWRDDAVRFEAVDGAFHYFLLTPSIPECAGIVPIPGIQAVEWHRNTKFVPPGTKGTR